MSEFSPLFLEPRNGETCFACRSPVQQTNGHGGSLYRCVNAVCAKFQQAKDVISHHEVLVDWNQPEWEAERETRLASRGKSK